MVSDVNTFIAQLNGLPSPSPVLQKLNAVLTDPASSADEIVRVIRMDPGLSTRVLRYANSAYIGIPRTIASLQNAVVLLGVKRIRSLLFSSLTFTAVHRRNPGSDFLLNFWRHSITVALIAEVIAGHLKRSCLLDTDEFFCTGMLHDIGKLVIFAFDPERIERTRLSSVNLQMPFFTAEELALNHMIVGEVLASQWHFPHSLTCALKNHHSPQACSADVRLNSIIHIADTIAHVLGFSTLPDEPVPPFDEAALLQVDLEPERLKVIAQDAVRDAKRIEALLEFFVG